MNQTILFRFVDAERVEWLKNGATPVQATLGELASQTHARSAVLVIPGETVTLTHAQVPGRNRATRTKAVPYAVEDNLAEDVEYLHFASVDRRPSGMDTPVAVISRKQLSAWLDACASAGVSPTAVIPDTLLLPFTADAWSLLVEQDRAVVRAGPWEGFGCERDDLALLLRIALGEPDDPRPRTLRVWGNAPPELTGLDVEIQTQARPGTPLELFAEGYECVAHLDLLQGPYSRRTHLNKWLRPWRAAAVLAGLCLGLQAAQQIAEYWQLRQEHAALRVAMENLYREAVPSARKIVNPKVQLENRLGELRGDVHAGQAPFLDLLFKGGSALRGFTNINLRGLRYNANQLELNLEGGSLEALDQLKQHLAGQADLDAQIRTTKREGQVESLVTLRSSDS